MTRVIFTVSPLLYAHLKREHVCTCVFWFMIIATLFLWFESDENIELEKKKIDPQSIDYFLPFLS